MRELDPYAVPLNAPMLVEASAGTGKTYALAILALRGVVELGLLPERLLVVTFTRAATAELRSRIRGRLRQARAVLEGEDSDDEALVAYLKRRPRPEECRERLERALAGIDEAAIFTIHGFCQRVLSAHAFETGLGFDRELVESTEEVELEIVSDFLVKELGPAPRSVVELILDQSVSEASFRALLALLECHPDALVEPTGPEDTEASATPEHTSGPLEGGPWEELLSARAAFEAVREELRVALAEQSVLSRIIARVPKNKKKNLDSNSRPAKASAALGAFLSAPLAELADVAVVEKVLAIPEIAEDSLALPLLAVIDGYAALWRCVAKGRVRLRQRFVRYARTELGARKRRLLVQSYSDLLGVLDAALATDAGPAMAERLRLRYPLALIDEFQDTDRIQCRVLSRIYAEPQSRMAVIGDPKQAIYSFRGADVRGYLGVARRPGLTQYGLRVNYRSDPAMLEALSALYADGSVCPFGEGISYTPVSARQGSTNLSLPDGTALSGLDILLLKNDSADALTKDRAELLSETVAVAWIAKLLGSEALIGQRPVRPSDIAVLTRSNAEAARIHRALVRAGIPSVQAGQASVLKSAEALALRALLSAVLSPQSPRDVASALFGPILAVSPNALAAMGDDELQRDEWAERLHRWGRVWESDGPARMLAGIFDELSVVERLLAEPGGERVVTNLGHLVELLETAYTKERLGRRAQIKWLEDAAADVLRVEREMRELRIESDEQASIVVTVHRSKGLEYPFVVMPYGWRDRTGRRPKEGFLLTRPGLQELDQRPRIRLDPELMAEEARQCAEQALARDARAEEARLLYVALTRARHAVCLVVPDVRGLESSALGELLGVPPRATVGQALGVEGFGFLDRLVERCPSGVIRVWPLSESSQGGVTAELPMTSARRLVEPAPLARVVSVKRRTTSYSALVKRDSGTAEPARDTDAHCVEPAEELEHGGELVPMAGLVAGPHVGEALHAILEEMDFTEFVPAASRPDIESILRRFGIDAELFGPLVRNGLHAVVEAPLLASDPTFSLRTVPNREKCVELEFTLPVNRLSREALAERLGSAVTGMDADYQKTLAGLGFAPVDGSLRGYIDLVFRRQGQIYVVDYKSNRLGERIGDYDEKALGLAMREHHYPLQAAIYAWAVHRWLKVTARDYDYSDFGGVLYVFLRGIAPGQPPGHSVFFHRPDPVGLAALGELFSGATS